MEREVDMQLHGGDIYRNKGVLDFSVNSNPLGAPYPVVQAVREAADEIECYPDIHCEELRQAIEAFEQVPAEWILCGNGAAELFFAAALAVMPKRALLVSPTFSEYERALQSAGAKVSYYTLSEKKGFQVDEGILDMITPETDMVFLCNPNNPTGCLMPAELLKKVLQRCEVCGTVPVLDECFIDFVKNPELWEMKPYLETCPGLLIIKAFTKIFAMPGLRLGYGMSADVRLLDKMRRVLQPWNVSGPAQKGGIAALTKWQCGREGRENGKKEMNYCPGTYIAETRDFLAKERAYMTEALRQLGFTVFDSRANYIFFKGVPGLYEEALAAGFLIRDCSSYRGLSPGYCRIAVRTRDENERLLTWLRKL